MWACYRQGRFLIRFGGDEVGSAVCIALVIPVDGHEADPVPMSCSICAPVEAGLRGPILLGTDDCFVNLVVLSVLWRPKDTSQSPKKPRI